MAKHHTRRRAVIIGAGPAGLTAALELLRRTDIQPVVYEMTDAIGGISRTVNHHGNRIDIGGHRFFSKSDRVMRWWTDIFPVQGLPEAGDGVEITYQRKRRHLAVEARGPDPDREERLFLVRRRLSRILYDRKLFRYPLSLNVDTLRKLGIRRVLRIGMSYLHARLRPIRDERSLRDFIINRFGRELYETFFRDYTQKVWGVPCEQISADWGAQRIKGLSIGKALAHALRGLYAKRDDIRQKGTETSLIERFIYPKYGPGQLWEEVARQVVEQGGELHLGWRAETLRLQDGAIAAVGFRDGEGNQRHESADYVFSTMPVRELVRGLEGPVPDGVRQAAQGLEYRDFLTVGLLLRRFGQGPGPDLQDNWIYVQEPDVRVGRIQVFNNWSPYMVRDRGKTWVGLEYFCNEGDALWRQSDDALVELAVAELARLGFVTRDAVLDSTVVRQPKAYPAYFGGFERFDEVRAFVDTIANLFLVGRNGMHRYNNQDHSMLTAMLAVDNIVDGVSSKDNLWSINAESAYHEERDEARR